MTPLPESRPRRHSRVRFFYVCLGFLASCSVPKGLLLRSGDAAGPGPDGAAIEEGIASWYDEGFQGRPTASGERFDTWAMTAAHPTLALGTWIEVANRANGRSIIVRVNDRGPFRKGRILDLSREAARRLGFLDAGVATVRISVVRKAPSPRYTIQVGSFLDRESADDLARDLETEHPGVAVTSGVLGGVTYHRVRIGSFASLEEAVRRAAGLDSAGLNPILMRDPPRETPETVPRI